MRGAKPRRRRHKTAGRRGRRGQQGWQIWRTRAGCGRKPARTQNILNIQPVIPIHLNADWNLISRTIAPIVDQPDVASSTGGDFGLGDINSTLFLSPAKPSKLIWGVAPVIELPTSVNDRVGPGKLGFGPSAVGLTMYGHWVVGALVNNVWSVWPAIRTRRSSTS